MAVHKAGNDSLPPNKWPVVKLADVGWEDFVKEILDIHAIVDAGTIFEPKRQEVKEAITSIVMDGLMPAFLELREIRASIGQSIPLMNRWLLYEDFARKLWKAYKDLTEKAARSMGFKIGFLFDDQKKFTKGLREFRVLHPRLRDGFEAYLEQTRVQWQNDLAKFRNTWIEHQRGDRKPFAKFYQPQYAEDLFNVVWRTIAQILPELLELHLRSPVSTTS